MEENKLSDHEVDNRLKEALRVLGEKAGATSEGNAAIDAAREFLLTLSIALIKAEVERDSGGASTFCPGLKG